MSESITVYGALAAPFDHVFRDNRGGFEFDYATGEQVVSRLNEVLGFDGWSFQVAEHGINAEADEAWVRGCLTVYAQNGRVIVREQFGSQKLKRSRSSGTPLDIGFDLKASATDALKKCASLIGVALYLSKKDEQPASDESAHPGGPARPDGTSGPPQCSECGAVLTETRFRDGTAWKAEQLAGFGQRKHNRVLCMEHYRAANDARRRSERAAEPMPF